MAKIIIDNRDPVFMDTAADETIYELLLRAQTDLWQSDQSIKDMHINGQLVEPLDVDTLKKLPATDATLELTLVTHDPENRTPLDTLNDTRTYLAHLKTGLEQLAEQIRTNPQPENFTTLGNVMNGLSAVIELFDALSSMDDTPQELQNDLKAFLDEITIKSRELLEGQETEDATLIADILEYEFIDSLDTMLDLLDRFAQIFRDRPEAP